MFNVGTRDKLGWALSSIITLVARVYAPAELHLHRTICKIRAMLQLKESQQSMHVPCVLAALRVNARAPQRHMFLRLLQRSAEGQHPTSAVDWKYQLFAKTRDEYFS